MAFDAHANLAYSTVAVAPSPAVSGLTIEVAAGQGALFPAAPFNATIWPVNAFPLTSNAEIVRVTAIVGDVLTIVRTQEGTSARAIVVGDQIANTITTKVIEDIEAAIVGGGITNIGVSAGTRSDLRSDLTFADSNGISFGLQTDGVITGTVRTNYQASGNYLTTAGLSQDSSKYAGTAGAITGGSITVNTSGVSVSLPAYLTTAMQSNAVTLSNIKVSAGTLTALRSDLTFSNSNGISFGLNTNGVLTGTVATNYQSQGAYLTTAALSQDSSKYAATGFTTTTIAGAVVAGTHNTAGLKLAVPDYLTTAALSQDSSKYAGTNGAITGGSITVNTSGVSVNLPAYLTTAALSQDSSKYAGTNGAITGGSITVNTSGVSVNLPAYLTTAMQSARGSDFVQATAAFHGTNASGTIASNDLSVSVAAQSVQTQNLFNLTLSGNTSGTLTQVSSGTLTLAGGNNITLSQNGNAITISGANVGGAQTGISGIVASDATYTSGTVTFTGVGGGVTVKSNTGQRIDISVAAPVAQTVQTQNVVDVSLDGNTAGVLTLVSSGTVIFAGGNNITLSQDGQSITISGPTVGGAQTGISGIVVSNTTYTSGTVSFSNQNNITIGSSVDGGTQYIRLSVGNYLTTAMASNRGSDFVQATAGFNGTNASGTIASDAISVSVAAQSVQSAIKGFGVSDTGQTAGDTGISTGIDWVLAGSQSITLSQSTTAGGPNTVWMQHPAWLTTAMQSNAVTLSNFRISAGTTSNLLSRLTFADGNGISFGLDASTITATVKTDYLTTAMASNRGSDFVQATAAFNGTNASGTIASDAISVSVNAQTVQSAIKAFGASNTGNTVGNTGVSTGIDWVLAATNSLTVSQSTTAGGPNTLWLSVGPYLTTAMASNRGSDFVQATAGFNGTNASGTIASDSISISVAAPIPKATAVKAVASIGSTGTITRYAPEDHQHAGVAAFAVTNTGNTAGDTRSQVGTFYLAASGAITASQSTAAAGNDTVWLSVAAQTNQSAIKAFGASNTGNTAGNTGVSTGIDWVLAATNSLTVSQSTTGGGPNTLWLSVGAYLTTAMASNRGSDFVQATAGFNGTNASGTIASDSISVSVAAPIPIGTAVKAVASVGSTGTITRYAPEDHQHAGVAAFAVTNTGSTAGNTRSQVGTLYLAASGNITASQSTAAAGNDTVWLSVPAQSNQTVGLYMSSNTTSSVSSGTVDARSLTFRGVGVASVGYSGGEVIVSVPSGGITNINLSAGTTSNLLSKVTFADSNGVSFGLNASTITATVSTYNTVGTATTGKAVASANSVGTITRWAAEDHAHAGVAAFAVTNTGSTAGNTRSQVGTLYLAASGNITASQSTAAAGNDTVWLSVPAQTNQTVGLYMSSNTTSSVSSGTVDARSLTFRGVGIASVGYSGGEVIVSVPSGGGGITNINISAGTTSNLLSKLTFADSNGVSFGLNGSTITATVSTYDIVDSATTVKAVASANSVGTVTRWAMEDHAHAGVAAFGISTAGNSVGTSGSQVGTYWLQGGNNITISQITSNNGSHTAIISGPSDATLSMWPYPLPGSTAVSTYYSGSTSQGAGGGSTKTGYTFSLYAVPMDLPAAVAFSELRIGVSNTRSGAGTGSVTHLLSVGFYTNNASTLSLVKGYYGGLGFSQNSVTSNIFKLFTMSTGSNSVAASGGYGGLRSDGTIYSSAGNITANSQLDNTNAPVKFIRVDDGVATTFTAGQYYCVLGFASASASVNVYGNTGILQSNAISSINIPDLGRENSTQTSNYIPAWGAISTTFTSVSNAANWFPLPSAIAISDMTMSNSSGQRFHFPFLRNHS